MTLAGLQFAGDRAVPGWNGRSAVEPAVSMNNWYAFSTNTHDVGWVCRFVFQATHPVTGPDLGPHRFEEKGDGSGRAVSEMM